MPMPPITMAMRGASVLDGGNGNGLRVECEWPRAVRADLRDGAVARIFQQLLVDRRLGRCAIAHCRGSTTSWRLPLEPSMMVTVLLLGGGGAGAMPGIAADDGGGFRRPVRRNGNAACRRRCPAAAWSGGRRLGRDHRHRLAAERIVDENRPGHDGMPNSPSAPASSCGAATGSFGPSFSFVLAERGVQIIRRHGRILANHRASLARGRTFMAVSA